MRKKIMDIIIVPEGIKVEIIRDKLKISKGNEELEKRMVYPVEIKDDKLILSHETPTKKEKKLLKTMKAHVQNMISGLENKFVYKLQVCSVHFPMNVSVKGDEFIVKNFLGEVKERKTKIIPGVSITIEKDIVSVESSDKNKAGQTAANIENVTKIRNRDRRVFQDGIYMTEKQKGAKR